MTQRWLLGSSASNGWAFQQTCVSIEMWVTRACASTLLYQQFNYGQFFQDAVMSTHIFKTCPSSERSRERKRGSGQRYEIQEHKSHPLQAHHNRLSPSRSNRLLRKSQIPEGFRQKTKHSSPSHHRAASTSPQTLQMLKKKYAFPFLLSFPPAPQLAMGNSYRKGHVFPYYLTYIY